MNKDSGPGNGTAIFIHVRRLQNPVASHSQYTATLITPSWRFSKRL